jgi:hypothetical protein
MENALDEQGEGLHNLGTWDASCLDDVNLSATRPSIHVDASTYPAHQGRHLRPEPGLLLCMGPWRGCRGPSNATAEQHLCIGVRLPCCLAND